MGGAASEIAARRQTDPVSLRRLVDGDLNSITMKALERVRVLIAPGEMWAGIVVRIVVFVVTITA